MQSSLPIPDFASLIRATNKKENKNKGGGTPADATHQIRTIRVRRGPSGARCAYRRYTAVLGHANQRAPPAPAALPGTGLKGGRSPPPPVPVQPTLGRPVIVPAGRFAEAARERRWRGPGRGHRSRPTSPRGRPRSLQQARRRRLLVAAPLASSRIIA